MKVDTGAAPGAPPWRVFFWLFAASFFFYWFTAGSNFTSGDAYAELNVANSLIGHGWFNVPVLKPGQLCAGWGCQGVDGRFYATHGIGYSLWLIPFLLLARLAEQITAAPHCETWTACVPIHLIAWNTCILTAATVSLLALLCWELGYSLATGTLVAVLYGFASAAWPYASYGFDVPLTTLLLLAAIRPAIQDIQGVGPPGAAGWPWRRSRWALAGLFTALSILTRVSLVLLVVPLTTVLVVRYHRASARHAAVIAGAFTLPVALALAFVAWYNAVRFGSVLNDGHAHVAATQLSPTPWQGVLGPLISPGKGLPWYSPVFLLAIIAFPSFWRRRQSLAILCLAAALSAALPYMLVNDWYGGAAWGPRFDIATLPLLLLPLVELPGLLRGRPAARRAAAGVLALSVLVQLEGLLVSYPDRLRHAAQAGVADRIYWDPRYSPLVDHLGVLSSYVVHLQAATLPVPRSQSFTIWWQDLWRIDEVPRLPSLLGGLGVFLCALVATWRCLQALRQVGSE
jgi:hypothetical protein